MTLTNKTGEVQQISLNNRLTSYLHLCKENDVSVMDPYGNSRNQRGRRNIGNIEEEPEEKTQYGHQDSIPFIDPHNISAQDALQQRLLERLQAEERHQLRQQNQQLLQLAQNQARRRQLVQQQFRQAVSNVADPLSDMPLLDINPLMQSPQERHRQIEYLRARRQNLMQLHLLREQRLRQEEELLEEMLRGEQRQDSLIGLDGGLSLATSSMRLRPLTNPTLRQQVLNLPTRMMSGADFVPELQVTRGHIDEEQELMDRIIQSQRHQASTLDVDTAIDHLDASMSRIQGMDSHFSGVPINTAPASRRAIDTARLHPGLQLSRRHFTGQALGEATFIDSTQEVALQPWMTQSMLSSSYPSTDLKSTSVPKGDVKKKSAEKKKSSSRKKVAGMPKRPLHAYNIYFQEERQKILKEIPSPPENDDDKKLTPGARRKRRRRGTHGKITFASLAKEIGFKWHNLDKEKKEHYQQLAEIELKRYDDEMDAYNLKQKEKEKEEQESLDMKPKAKDEDDMDSKEEDDGDDEHDEEEDSGVEINEEDSLSVAAVSAKKARER